MSAQTSDGWPGTVINDRRMIDFEDEIAPPGKKWECCTACQGKGKILVDDIIPVPRPESTPLSDGLKRYPSLYLGDGVNWGIVLLKRVERGTIHLVQEALYVVWHVNDGKKGYVLLT